MGAEGSRGERSKRKALAVWGAGVLENQAWRDGR